jgi:hypothetical protein
MPLSVLTVHGAMIIAVAGVDPEAMDAPMCAGRWATSARASTCFWVSPHSWSSVMAPALEMMTSLRRPGSMRSSSRMRTPMPTPDAPVMATITRPGGSWRVRFMRGLPCRG